MSLSVLDLVLIGLLVFQQVYWSIETHKLLNKLMSRSYYEYKQAEGQTEPLRVKLPPEDTEDVDLGILQDFRPL